MNEKGRVEAMEQDREGQGGTHPPIPPARLRLAAVLLALFTAMLLYKVLHAGHLEQTALFYVGLPAFIALSVSLWARPRSATGTALASVTIGLALAGPLLNEGVVCLVMAAPLFYLLAVIIGWTVDRARRRRGRGDGGAGRAHAFVSIPLLALLVVEGTGIYELPRETAASATRTVSASPAEYEAALAATPRFADPEPLFLRAVPFPRPQKAEGDGLDVGDARAITFNPRKGLGIGARPAPRAMRLVVAERSAGRVVFRIEKDTTLARWLALDSAEVEWAAADGGGTKARWTLHYRRTYDPGWYFGPLQKYGMEQAAAYLSDTFTAGARR
ncbi:hypothetical protein [Streptomyces sp. NPDC047108]|uniref:hypothetical protein n=1 Tax=Streptomyces sp. NPDC047108 TaxID=3155025 RepID=UPI0033F8ED21